MLCVCNYIQYMIYYVTMEVRKARNQEANGLPKPKLAAQVAQELQARSCYSAGRNTNIHGAWVFV